MPWSVGERIWTERAVLTAETGNDVSVVVLPLLTAHVYYMIVSDW